MEDRNVKWRVGVIAVATFVATALLIAASTSVELPFGVGQYQLQIRTTRAPGVGRNTPVRRDGVLIGRVDRTEPVQGGRLITVHINQNEPLLSTDTCRIRPSSLFGDAVIEFAQTDLPGGVAVEPDAVVEGEALRDPLDVITNLDISESVESLGKAGDAVAELATRINTIIGEEATGERISSLLDKAIAAMDEFDATMSQVSGVASDLDAIIGDQQTQQGLKQALAAAPDVMSNVLTVVQQAATTLTSLDAAVTSAERNLKNIEGVTAPIGERGPQLVESVLSALENLDVALADVSRFARSLGDSEGTLGKLVTDDELYNNLNVTICNANQVVHRINELAKQARPILTDVRIFTDKVSREPSELVRGVVGPQSLLK